MATPYKPIPSNLRAVISEPLVDSQGKAGLDFQKYLVNLTQMLQQLAPVTVEQQDLAKFSSNLNRSSIQLVWVPTYNHFLSWNGTGWEFAPGDLGSGWFATFLVTPPAAAGWQLCLGFVASYLRADGTVGNVILPNTPGQYFRI